jgi:hypothetical protein
MGATSGNRPRDRKSKDEQRGLEYGRGVVGKHRFRVRERHIAHHLIPLIAKRSVGAAKLDLLLRGVALPPDVGERPDPGLVLPRYRYEHLYDLVRAGRRVGAQEPGTEGSTDVLRLKRKWVRGQLLQLERLRLVERIPQPGRRSRLLVRSDDGLGGPFDDPDGSEGNLYITILGSVISSGRLATWGAPELSAYLAAMVAERWAPGPRRAPGTGTWYRPLEWFADSRRRYGPDDRTPMAFSVATLERGIAKLEKEGLLSHTHITVDPHSRERLQGRRNLYVNQFTALDRSPHLLRPDELAERLVADTAIPT